MVILLHQLPDGTRHFDWLVQRFQPAPGHRPPLDPEAKELLSYRVVERIDHHSAGFFIADRIADHRNKYLEVTRAEISGGRGIVQKVAAGIVRRVEEMPGAVSIRGKFAGGAEYMWAGMQKDNVWEFQRSQPIQVGPSQKFDWSKSDDDDGDIDPRIATVWPVF